MSDIQEKDRQWYYFGCRYHSGHYLHNRHGSVVYLDALDHLDGELCPRDKTPYRAILYRIPHLRYSSLGWWDNTVDTRPGSNSIILAPSPTCSLESIRKAMTLWFPWVEARLPVPLVVLGEERIYSKGDRRDG